MMIPSRSVRIAAGFLLFTAVAALAPTFAQSASVGQHDTARIEQVIQGYVTAGTFMGTVLVARDGVVVVDKGYGLANVEWDVPNTPATKFRIGSITKQFTAAAILLLEERGKLKVEDRTKIYLPNQPASWDRITIYNLLTHTSGLANFTTLPSFHATKGSATTVEGALATLRDRVLDFGPGEDVNYSNSGYMVLGAIIEMVTGQSYEKFLAENFFTPLAMSDSGYDSSAAIIKRRASGYIKTPAGYANADYIHMSVPHAAGALYSTTADLLKWEHALFGGKVLSQASVDRMITPFKNDYALGLASFTEKGRRVISHAGEIDGFNTFMAYYPGSRTVVVVLSNVNGTVPPTLAAQLGSLMHGEAVTLMSERREIAVPAAILSKYVGVYDLAPIGIVTITLEGNHLMAQVTGQGKQPIFADSESLFFLKVVDAQIQFAADGSSQVFHQDGRSAKALRKAS
jgi:CubicO group peptidase (beta-lactamase class C family)